MSYDLLITCCQIAHCIEGSPDHWWVTTKALADGKAQAKLKGHQIIGELRPFVLLFFILVCCIEGSPDHWWVTTVGYFLLFRSHDWRVTRSLVSYDNSLSYKEGGKQIEGSPDHWWVTTSVPLHIRELLRNWRVTRSLVSYDRIDISILFILIYWRVTRSLVSYDNAEITSLIPLSIEGSPDHWWVTTKQRVALLYSLPLKGHQIIGELRLNVRAFP